MVRSCVRQMLGAPFFYPYRVVRTVMQVNGSKSVHYLCSLYLSHTQTHTHTLVPPPLLVLLLLHHCSSPCGDLSVFCLTLSVLSYVRSWCPARVPFGASSCISLSWAQQSRCLAMHRLALAQPSCTPFFSSWPACLSYLGTLVCGQPVSYAPLVSLVE